MALPTKITDLSTSAASNSPAGSDSIGTSLDDFLRIIQAFERQLFDTGTIYSSVVGGTADIITLTPTPALTVYKAGQGIAWISSGANTTNVTVNVSALGAKAITKNGTTALVAGDIPSGALVIAIYDGTEFQIQAPATVTVPNALPWVIAGGTADAITTTYSPAITSLTDGLILTFRAASANATTTPTFAPNALTAHTITKLGGAALVAGDIKGNLAEYFVRYNLANTRWELLNPSIIGVAQLSGTLPTTSGGTGVAASNPVIQQTRVQTGAVATGSTTIPDDDTIPQNTEGDQYMSLAHTPLNSANILRIDVVANFSNSGSANTLMALFQDSTANALTATRISDTPSAGRGCQVVFSYYMTAGTTSSTTFKLRIGGDSAATITFNGTAGARRFGGVNFSSIIITEYAA